VVALNGDTELAEIVLTLSTPGRLARRLNRRQEHRDEDANDRDHHEELH
jgi:hypothetical protein